MIITDVQFSVESTFK